LQRIMLIEDSPQDREATIRALKKSGIVNSIFHCEDGDEALNYLYRREQYVNPESSPRPSMIFLDLNMPGTDGFEVLSQIKTDTELKKIPVIVLTTSSDIRDINKSYRIGANSYIQQPVNLPDFEKAIILINQYWFEIVILPEGIRTKVCEKE